MSVVRLGDWVLPRESRSIIIGCGSGGWGPDSQPAKVLKIDGDTNSVVCEFQVAPWGMNKGVKPDVFTTSIAGLHKTTEVHATAEAQLCALYDAFFRYKRTKNHEDVIMQEMTKDGRTPDFAVPHGWERNKFKLQDGRVVRVHISLEVTGDPSDQ
jgi:hypothetical protein